MEVKHKECFIPNTINFWDLQAVSKYAREAAEYVNLYSKHRGINRFPALINVLDLIAGRAECVKRGYRPHDISSLRAWAKTEPRLGNPALKAYCESQPEDAIMRRAFKWSLAVNDTIEGLVRGVPPFPFVRESLIKLRDRADIVVVSATPGEALGREWNEHDIAQYVKVIAGQEMGSKKECIALSKAHGYADIRVLMIGDAPGDLSAARANNALFFPIDPGGEDDSWQAFFEEGISRFLALDFKGAYENELIRRFDASLPGAPPWK
jgi:phosphoglycolate phosphatase-like HAD superfamily hydrolase